ncbi:MAG: hypothetical protein FH761_04100 [Firmicutes bacterium]|nr:hypothetical protein [Bacillota bacterium]
MFDINAKKFFQISIGIILTIVVALMIFSYILLNRTTIYEGINISGVDVSKLNRMEAIEKLQNEFEDEINKSVLILRYEDYIYKAKYSDLGVGYDYYKAVEDSLAIGRQKSIIEKLKDILHVRINGGNIGLGLLYDDKKIDRIIEDVRKDICINSEDAKIEYINGSFNITPEVIGQKINIDVFRMRIIAALKSSKEVKVPVEKDLPKITEKMLDKIKANVGGFSTSFGGSSEARKNNIQVATMKINGQLILPGEVFSFNKATGFRNRETGYMISKVIVDGKFVDDIGGGVCQVSTTLYNAVLRAGLEIVERTHHSLPVGYVPKGADATVSYGYLDLKFKNNYDFPIYIRGLANSYAVTFQIYGGQISGSRSIDIVSEIEERVEPDVEKRIDNNLAPWSTEILQQGRYGYKVKTYRVFYEDGEVVKRELISDDFYKPKKYIIRVGPGNSKTSSIQDNNYKGRLVQ